MLHSLVEDASRQPDSLMYSGTGRTEYAGLIFQGAVCVRSSVPGSAQISSPHAKRRAKPSAAFPLVCF